MHEVQVRVSMDRIMFSDWEADYARMTACLHFGKTGTKTRIQRYSFYSALDQGRVGGLREPIGRAQRQKVAATS
jgi:hypothetical protein